MNKHAMCYAIPLQVSRLEKVDDNQWKKALSETISV